jgi:hypothetical protein
MEDTMSSLTRTMLPAFALAAMMSIAQAQTTGQDHDAHHPGDATATPAQEAQPGASGNAATMGQGTMSQGTMGQGMGSGAVVQPGTQQPGGKPGMMGSGMMNMDQMHSMMSGMMGQRDGQPGMMGNMGQMMPMMRHMMMGQQGGMGMPFEHVEGRIAFLEAELKITDTQKPYWNAFADTLRANSKAHQAMHEQMTKSGMPSTWPERLAFQQKMLSTRLDSLKDMEAAIKPLYATLNDEQRKLADQLMSGPMGMM